MRGRYKGALGKRGRNVVTDGWLLAGHGWEEITLVCRRESGSTQPAIGANVEWGSEHN